MIQRIQTIYLFLAAALGMAAIFVPFPYAFSGTNTFNLSAASQQFNFMDNISMVSLIGGIAFFCLVNIFLFKRQTWQINLCRLSILAVLALVGVGAYFVLADATVPDLPYVSAGFPLLMMLFIWLALRGVKADIALVESTERLR